MTATFAALLVLLAVSTVTDLKYRKIPNAWTAAGVVAGLALGVMHGQIGGAFLGMFAGLAIGLPLFAVRAIGGGDAKLIAAVGTLMGPTSLVSALLYAGIAGGVMALLQALRRGRLSSILGRALGLTLWIASLGRGGERRGLDTPGATSIPYGAAIAAGALAAWFFPLFAGATP